jgi:hypothetical protein
MSSFQKFIISTFYTLNSSIILNMILTKVYCIMDNFKLDKINVQYDFTF